jgi:hypothetical protein
LDPLDTPIGEQALDRRLSGAPAHHRSPPAVLPR